MLLTYHCWGGKKVFLYLSRFYQLVSELIDMRQINRTKSNLITYIWGILTGEPPKTVR